MGLGWGIPAAAYLVLLTGNILLPLLLLHYALVLGALSPADWPPTAGQWPPRPPGSST